MRKTLTLQAYYGTIANTSATVFRGILICFIRNRRAEKKCAEEQSLDG